MSKTGRNEPCPCGSGKKYKRCCLNNVGPTPPLADPPGTDDPPPEGESADDALRYWIAKSGGENRGPSVPDADGTDWEEEEDGDEWEDGEEGEDGDEGEDEDDDEGSLFSVENEAVWRQCLAADNDGRLALFYSLTDHERFTHEDGIPLFLFIAGELLRDGRISDVADMAVAARQPGFSHLISAPATGLVQLWLTLAQPGQFSLDESLTLFPPRKPDNFELLINGLHYLLYHSETEALASHLPELASAVNQVLVAYESALLANGGDDGDDGDEEDGVDFEDDDEDDEDDDEYDEYDDEDDEDDEDDDEEWEDGALFDETTALLIYSDAFFDLTRALKLAVLLDSQTDLSPADPRFGEALAPLISDDADVSAVARRLLGQGAGEWTPARVTGLDEVGYDELLFNLTLDFTWYLNAEEGWPRSRALAMLPEFRDVLTDLRPFASYASGQTDPVRHPPTAAESIDGISLLAILIPVHLHLALLKAFEAWPRFLARVGLRPSGQTIPYSAKQREAVKSALYEETIDWFDPILDRDIQAMISPPKDDSPPSD